MDWIRNYIKPDDIVYDVGANVGAYSLLIGKMVSQGAGKVYAFEPGAANFHSLSRNIEANGLSSNIIIFPIDKCLGVRIRDCKIVRQYWVVFYKYTKASYIFRFILFQVFLFIV